MKTFYSILMAMVAVVLFAPLAVADPGQTWDKKINRPNRFKVLSQFNGKAVLDKETGRVWEQSPSTPVRSWFEALHYCYGINVGGRKGWRLPTIEELASLVDTTRSNPALPASHPFDNVRSSFLPYWSATTDANFPGTAWTADFNLGGVQAITGKDLNELVWCVRGGQGIDGVQ